MSSMRHLVDLERWPIAQAESWKSPVSFLPRVGKSPGIESRRRVLEETVERQVVPRLLAARHSSDRLPMCSGALAQPGTMPIAREVVELVRLVANESMSLSRAYVDRIRARGVPLEAIFLHLLTPAANILGDMWVEDTADFATVTIATSRLQQILRECATDFHSERRARQREAHALLVTLPGDQHTFGVSMLQEFFRREGWLVSSDIPKCRQDLVDLAGTAPFRLIGISVSCDAVPEGLASLIKDLRRAAFNPKCRIVVGGRLFLSQPDLVRIVGADATALDAKAAARQLSSLLDTKAV